MTHLFEVLTTNIPAGDAGAGNTPELPKPKPADNSEEIPAWAKEQGEKIAGLTSRLDERERKENEAHDQAERDTRRSSRRSIFDRALDAFQGERSAAERHGKSIGGLFAGKRK